MKRILVVLNYYFPYISGVSEYARLMAEECVRNGYDVTVLTSNHANLPQNENINGVNVIRTKVWFKISKGTISPDFIKSAIKLSKEYDVIHLHVPMIESGIISILSRNKNIVTTYHCDINLPKTLLNSFIIKVMDISNKWCLKRSKKVVVSSLDYAMQSRVASGFEEKLVEITTPIKDYYRINNIKGSTKKRIGFCGRIVEEKGINVLIKAYEHLLKKRKDIELIIGGDYKNIAGGSVYPELISYINAHNIEGIEFIGRIPENEMATFYSSLDVMTLPSINTLEAFGMVQVEAMLCGTPVVASDLPGVRTIVQKTGMGEIARRNDYIDLAEKIEKVLDNPTGYIKPREEIEARYGIKHIYDAYINTYFEGK